jgi:hypothetical protein
MFVISILLLIVFKLLLAGKDASSYLLKDKVDNNLTVKRIQRWHRDGVALDLIFTGVLTWATSLYIEVPILSVLLRLAVYDSAFNQWAGLDIRYLGSTSWIDRQFVKIFGLHGALEKSFVFLGITVIWGILKLIYE